MPGEFDIIRRYFAGQGPVRDDVVLGIGDDGAHVRLGTADLAIAVDALVEGVHFPEGTPARAIGHRVLAVNLSDLAAMGATPQWVTLALTLPSAHDNWLADFSAGFFELAHSYNVQLIGGDTVRGPLHVAVQAMGRIGERALRRDGGNAGDDVYVSGHVGDAAAGLRLFARAQSSHTLVQRFLYPTPRVELGLGLCQFASACIDISDGLAADLTHLTSSSGCGAVVNLESLPLSDALRTAFDSDECEYLALSGGDDYELCFSVPRTQRAAFARWCAQHDHQVARIGALCEGSSLSLQRNGVVVNRTLAGFDHFAHDA